MLMQHYLLAMLMAADILLYDATMFLLEKINTTPRNY